MLGRYKNSHTEITMRHENCGYEYKVKPYSFLNGNRCPNCFKSVPYTTETFSKKVQELVGDKYTVLGEYSRGNVGIKMRHNVCGYEWSVRPSLFIYGTRCPSCSKNLRRSLPEEIVAYILSQYYEVIQGYRPEWLQFPSGNNGEIDIWIPELKIGIEYDGVMHNTESLKERDAFKDSIIEHTSYCNLLYRIKESNENSIISKEKIRTIYLSTEINISGGKGIRELEKGIQEILNQLDVDCKKVHITKEIIQTCQNRLDDSYLLSVVR